MGRLPLGRLLDGVAVGGGIAAGGDEGVAGPAAFGGVDWGGHCGLGMRIGNEMVSMVVGMGVEGRFVGKGEVKLDGGSGLCELITDEGAGCQTVRLSRHRGLCNCESTTCQREFNELY